MALIYYDIDADLEILKRGTVAVLGCDDMARAHSRNLKDSGVPVIIGLQVSEGRDEAEAAAEAKADGFEVYGPAEAARKADVVAFLLPDHMQAQVYENFVAPNLKPGAALAFAGGFAVSSGLIVPGGNDVFMVASKGPGYAVRRAYTEGFGVPAFVAVHKNASGKAMDLALAYGSAIGAGRAGMLETTFAEEAECGLFTKQAVIYGGMPELIKAGFDTLVEAGYQPEAAYYNCLYEMKMAVDAIFDGGLSFMRRAAGDTANYCAEKAGRQIIGEGARETMKRLLADVKDGSFARDWPRENDSGREETRKWLKAERKHPFDKAGLKLRIMMPWMDRE